MYVCCESLQPSRLLQAWINEFIKKIVMLKPQFIALHLQEVGGKTYEKSMEYVQDFIKMLCESKELEHYTRIRVYLDEDYTSAEHFTVISDFYDNFSYVNILLMDSNHHCCHGCLSYPSILYIQLAETHFKVYLFLWVIAF